MKKALVLGLLLMPIILWAQQIEKLQKGVSQNDTKAMITLADRYQCGWGVAVDSAKAYSLYQKAMELGDADAKAHVARYLLYYSGIQRDTAQALRLCQQAADEGSLYGLYRLGRAYLNGYGVACDTAKAYKLMIQAAEGGDPAAMGYMASEYYYGFPGNEPDKDKGAAYALRGKVYLWLKEWAKAEADFVKVGECGYGMFDGSYADLFTVANEKCREMISSGA